MNNNEQQAAKFAILARRYKILQLVKSVFEYFVNYKNATYDRREKKDAQWKKKRKRHHKSELKRAALVKQYKDALREVQRKTDEQRSMASKYNKLWRRCIESNKKLHNQLNNKEGTTKKVYIDQYE